jgi:hypothetical protein
MGFIDRLGKVVRAELTSLTHPAGRAAADRPATSTREGATPSPAPLVTDVDGALRVLELHGEPTLQAVRDRAHELARHYYPKTTSTNAEEARAARMVLTALTEALELLEEHLLPVAAVPPSTPPSPAGR